MSPDAKEPSIDEIDFYVKRGFVIKPANTINYSEFKRWNTLKDRNISIVAYKQGTSHNVNDTRYWATSDFLYSKKGACHVNIIINNDLKLALLKSGWFCFNGLTYIGNEKQRDYTTLK